MGYSGIGQSPSIGKNVWVYPVVERALRLSGLKPEDKVVILTDTNRSQSIIDAFFAAASNINDNVFLIVRKPGFGGHGQQSREPNRAIVDVLKTCDFVIDLPTNHWAYTHAYNEVMDAGAKILLSCSDEELLYRLVPDEKVMQRTRRAANLITAAKTLRITSDLGTNLTMSVEGRVCNAQSGAVSEEFRWDNFPSALTEVAPVETSLNGTLVIAPGDPIVELDKRVSEKIVCTVENGSITKIEGGLEAKYLQDWFDQWNDPAVRTVAHTGFGTDHRATIFSQEAMDWESLDGGINLAFGANFARFLRGENIASAHIDIILLNSNFFADDVQLVKDGKTMLID